MRAPARHTATQLDTAQLDTAQLDTAQLDTAQGSEARPPTTQPGELVSQARDVVTESSQTTTDDAPRSWRRELLLVSVLYFAYTASRLASLAPAGAADRNGRRVLNFERALHIAPEHTLNDLLYAAPTWLSVASAYYYQTMHYVMTAATLIWLYRSGSAAYRSARTWLVAMTFPALIVFWLFPVAPPRSTPGAVAHDIVAEQHRYGWWGSNGGAAPRGLASLVNDNAALPSLHVGWALWVGWNLVHSSRNPVVRAFGYVYPLITMFVVLSTGNHYLVDVLSGTFLAVVAKLVADRILERRGRVRPGVRPGVQPTEQLKTVPSKTAPPKTVPSKTAPSKTDRPAIGGLAPVSLRRSDSR